LNFALSFFFGPEGRSSSMRRVVESWVIGDDFRLDPLGHEMTVVDNRL